MISYQDGYHEQKVKYPDKRYYTFDLPLTEIPDYRTKLFYYLPFNGHSGRLGHYYRHLFHTVRYVVEQKPDFLTPVEKYAYVKTIRGQLSNYEQLMLFYNAMAWFDDEWNEFFTDFRLIKNLPIGLADFGVLPLQRYKDDIQRLKEKGIEMFENI